MEATIDGCQPIGGDHSSTSVIINLPCYPLQDGTIQQEAVTCDLHVTAGGAWEFDLTCSSDFDGVAGTMVFDWLMDPYTTTNGGMALIHEKFTDYRMQYLCGYANFFIHLFTRIHTQEC